MTVAIVTPKTIDVIVTYHRNQRGLSFVRWLIGIIRSMRSALEMPAASDCRSALGGFTACH
jgi:hypothetical protein